MWWILGILMWLTMGVVTAILFAVDWELTFGDGDHFKYLWCLYCWGFIAPPLFFMVFFLDSNKRIEVFAIIGRYIGQWFKDNVDWRW